MGIYASGVLMVIDSGEVVVTRCMQLRLRIPTKETVNVCEDGKHISWVLSRDY